MDEQYVREKARLALGEEGDYFLRIHRDENALYVTDFPLRRDAAVLSAAKARLAQAGFVCRPCGRDGRLWALDLQESAWLHFLSLAAEMPDAEKGHDGLLSLSRLFQRYDSENTALARELLKLSVQKGLDGERAFRKISGMYALILRRHAQRPGRGCAGLIRQCMKRIES